MEREKRNEQLNAEKKWYKECKFEKDHILNISLFYSKKRNQFAYQSVKSQLPILLSKFGIDENSKLLLAPCGMGDDYEYIKAKTKFIYGIDISHEAVAKTPNGIKAVVGDMISMPYDSNYFDFVLTILFFHHVIDEGFDKYILEIKRVLKPGGYLIILEPSILFLIHWISRAILGLVGNITGAVGSERPLNPIVLNEHFRKHNFSNCNVSAGSFSYHRFPILLARIINFISPIFMRLPIIKYCGWMVYFVYKKFDQEF